MFRFPIDITNSNNVVRITKPIPESTRALIISAGMKARGIVLRCVENFERLIKEELSEEFTDAMNSVRDAIWNISEIEFILDRLSDDSSTFTGDLCAEFVLAGYKVSKTFKEAYAKIIPRIRTPGTVNLYTEISTCCGYTPFGKITKHGIFLDAFEEIKV